MRLAAALATVWVIASVAPASADPAADLAAEAVKLAAAGKYEEAAAKFRAAHRLDPKPSYLCNVGVAYQRAQALPKAQIYLGECLIRGTTLDAKFIGLVRDALGAVEDQLRAKDYTPLDIVVSPDGARVHVDGFADDETFVGSRVIWVPFGKHVVTVTADAYGDRSVDIETHAHTQQQVRVSLAPLAAGRPPVPDPATVTPVPTPPRVVPPPAVGAPRPEAPSRTPVIVAGAATGVLAIGAIGAYAYASHRNASAGDLLDLDAYNHRLASARAWQHASWGLGAAAGVGAIVTGYLFVRSRHAVEVTPTGGGAAVSFSGRW